MKKMIAILVIFSFLVFNFGLSPQAYAKNIKQDMVTENIHSISQAKDIAAQAEGGYWEGAVPPQTTGNEVALPVMDKEGNILGFIVADKEKLVAALNESGYQKVASALAAALAGTGAGLEVASGIALGTIGLATLGVATIVGIALIVSGGGSKSTSRHSK